MSPTPPEDETPTSSPSSAPSARTSGTSAPWERGRTTTAATTGAGSAAAGDVGTGPGSHAVRPDDGGPATQALPAVGGARSGGARRAGAVVDAPTSQIRRDAVPTDMPDLSETRRKVSGPSDRNRDTAGAAGSTGATGAKASTPRPSAARGTGRGPRRAALQIKRIDPWSALKLSLVLSVALFLVWMIAVGVLYLVLDGMGVWERINTTFSDFVTVSDPNGGGQLVGPTRVFGVAAVIGLVNVLLFTAIATISSFVYNLSSDLAGGVEVTLTERD